MILRIIYGTGYFLRAAILPISLVKNQQSAPKSSDGETVDSGFEYHETGWDRVKYMYSSNEYQAFTPEVTTIIALSTSVSAFGGIIGGLTHCRNEYILFMERNSHASFASHIEAKDVLTHKLLGSTIRGGIQWGWRSTVLTALFSTLMYTSSVYRGERTVYESVGSGLAVGALAGYAFHDKQSLGLVDNPLKMQRIRLNPLYATLKGAIIGVLIGLAITAYDIFTDSENVKGLSKTRYFEHRRNYIRERQNQFPSSTYTPKG